jgi:hypothetical protein
MKVDPEDGKGYQFQRIGFRKQAVIEQEKEKGGDPVGYENPVNSSLDEQRKGLALRLLRAHEAVTGKEKKQIDPAIVHPQGDVGVGHQDIAIEMADHDEKDGKPSELLGLGEIKKLLFLRTPGDGEEQGGEDGAVDKNNGCFGVCQWYAVCYVADKKFHYSAKKRIKGANGFMDTVTGA